MGFNIGAALGGVLDKFDEKQERDDALLDKAWDEYTQDRRTAKNKRDAKLEEAQQNLQLLKVAGFDNPAVAASIARGGTLAVQHAIQQGQAYLANHPDSSLDTLYKYEGPDYTKSDWSTNDWAKAVAGPSTTLDLGSYLGPKGDGVPLFGGRSLRERFTDRVSEAGIEVDRYGQTGGPELGDVTFKPFRQLNSLFDFARDASLAIENDSPEAESKVKRTRNLANLMKGDPTLTAEDLEEVETVIDGMDDAEFRQSLFKTLGSVSGLEVDLEQQIINSFEGVELPYMNALERAGEGLTSILKEDDGTLRTIGDDLKQSLSINVLGAQQIVFDGLIKGIVGKTDTISDVSGPNEDYSVVTLLGDMLNQPEEGFNHTTLQEILSEIGRTGYDLQDGKGTVPFKVGQVVNIQNAPNFMRRDGSSNQYAVWNGKRFYYSKMFEAGEYTRFLPTR
jgi:hypothetical protein